MKIPTKKISNGFEMPVFGLGTWRVAGDFNYDPNNDDEMDINSIRTAIDMGITHIDTAEVYAQGHTEIIIGQAIKVYNRAKLFICSKVSHTNLKYNDLIKSAKNSLNRLGIDYLDLYLIHFPNKDIPIKETMKAMNELVDNGLVKNIGVSNFNTQQLEEAQSNSGYKIVINQVQYNLIYRETERTGILRFCQENDLILTAWRPVQKGLLAKGGIGILDEMCMKYDKTPAQIAINWLISQNSVVTLAKNRNIEHLKENLGAIGWQMEQADVERLRAEFPGQIDIGEVYRGIADLESKNKK